MSDPNERDGMSVTIKGDEPGGKYNDAKSPSTWLVFHGSPERIREQIIATFEMEASANDMPLFQLINEATTIFKASGSVTYSLGGRNLSKSDSGWGQGSNNAESNEDSPESEDERAVKRVRFGIEKAESRADLKALYAREVDVFTAHEELVDEYKAKGKVLK